MLKLEHIAVIPARGGSKRLPRKNIIDFGGIPMIGHTIKAAIDSKVYDKVILSTDDDEIKEIGLQFGAEVPFLRNKHADDFSTVSDVTIDTLERLKGELHIMSENVSMLMPNCPLRTAQDIVNANSDFVEKDRSFQISAFEYGWMNPWWAHTIESDDTVKPLFPKTLKKRSQDNEKLYCPTGAIWMAKSEALLSAKTFYGSPLNFYILNWQAAVDIDNLADFQFAQALNAIQ